jgi:hypothetical protein
MNNIVLQCSVVIVFIVASKGIPAVVVVVLVRGWRHDAAQKQVLWRDFELLRTHARTYTLARTHPKIPYGTQ